MSELRPESSSWDRYLAFWEGESGQEVRRADSLLREQRVIRKVTVISLRYMDLRLMARQLVELDRELRRAASILDPLGVSRVDSIFVAGMTRGDIEEMYRQKLRPNEFSLPSPAPVRYGGLRIADASVGSLDFVVEAYRHIEDLLTSKPAQAFGLLLNFVGVYGGIRIWMNQRSDALARISSRDALKILREFGGHPEQIVRNAQPVSEIRVRGRERRIHDLSGASLTLSNGTTAAGRSITQIRVNEDGTQDIIHVEG